MTNSSLSLLERFVEILESRPTDQQTAEYDLAVEQIVAAHLRQPADGTLPVQSANRVENRESSTMVEDGAEGLSGMPAKHGSL